MLRRLRPAFVFAVLIAIPAATAQAQYAYPGGYSGWGGWGGGASTIQGDSARGMGAFAAGAGAYNQQTAQARAMNANTAMQMNEYIHAVNANKAQNYSARQNDYIKRTNEAAAATSKRLRETPTASDVRDGDAMNVVLDDLTNPKVYTQAVQKATRPVASGLVKNIEFQYAARMIAISLEDLSSRGVPDELLTNPAFADERAALKAIVTKAREESTSSAGSQISPETLAKGRAAIKALQDKVTATLPRGTKNRDEADNFLKALYGLTKMLASPDVAMFLKGLDQFPTTTLGHLLTFMHTFNLRFGVTKTPEQATAYEQLYPLLVTLRDQAYSGAPVAVADAGAAAPPPPNPKAATTFFSGMDFNHFGPQPAPGTGAPRGRPAPAPAPAPNAVP